MPPQLAPPPWNWASPIISHRRGDTYEPRIRRNIRRRSHVFRIRGNDIPARSDCSSVLNLLGVLIPMVASRWNSVIRGDRRPHRHRRMRPLEKEGRQSNQMRANPRCLISRQIHHRRHKSNEKIPPGQKITHAHLRKKRYEVR